jgi:hypothetical protein
MRARYRSAAILPSVQAIYGEPALAGDPSRNSRRRAISGIEAAVSALIGPAATTMGPD